MARVARLLVALVPLLVLLISAPWPATALAQDEDAVLLVASPGLQDLDYRQTVVLAAPGPSGGHIGVILNRPTRRSLASLFPEHEPSKKVIDPVYYGGPISRGALVAVVKADAAPGAGTVQLMKNLYMAFRVNTIDLVIETHPNDARYYVGYVGWLPGELQDEIERGIWTVLNADADVVFRKDMDSLWEEMLQRTKSIRAEMGPRTPIDSFGARFHGGDNQAAARAGAFSKVIFEPR
ncbi:MAG TPA: YqgE/AlgH family protein [Burkholderiales bacterium]|jgi:putative transcriptional regulator